MSGGGTAFAPHLDVCFLAVDEIDSTWRPVNPAPVRMAVTITLSDHPDGTNYQTVVRHGAPESRDHDETLGFAEGWGTVAAQLAALAESMK